MYPHMKSRAHESAMESLPHMCADKDGDTIKAVIEEGVEPKTILSKTTYARWHTKFAKSRDMSGTKARNSIASTKHE
jgi:hypothetical protein